MVMRSGRKPNWVLVLSRLRRAVKAGDASAMSDLGLTLADGIRDQSGRVLVRRNAPYAARLFRRAAECGDGVAAGALGYAYDVGNGVRANKRLALAWYHRAIRLGYSGTTSNIATVYRDRGDLKSAHRWSLRAQASDDGDASVTAGYDYLYGIGVRRNVAVARRLLDRSLRANTTEHGREEALYHLAVANIDAGQRRRAKALLRLANRDGDYPEAASLLEQLTAKEAEIVMPCRCRRSLNKSLFGHAQCAQHPH